jgi:hypothetical protein
VNCTAKKAGTVMTGGFSLPPERTTNVAGTRTLVEVRFARGVVGMLVLLADEVLLGVPDAEAAVVSVAVVAVAADEVVVVAAAEVDEDEWLELPHAPSSAVIGSSTRALAPNFTVFRIDVD